MEFCSYVIFYAHVYHHDNHVAVLVVKREVVRKRNRTNAISMTGLLITLLMELAYNCWIVIFMTRGNFEQLREIFTLVKMAEFSAVPAVQILTSPPLRNHVKKN